VTWTLPMWRETVLARLLTHQSKTCRGGGPSFLLAKLRPATSWTDCIAPEFVDPTSSEPLVQAGGAPQGHAVTALIVQQ